MNEGTEQGLTDSSPNRGRARFVIGLIVLSLLIPAWFWVRTWNVAAPGGYLEEPFPLPEFPINLHANFPEGKAPAWDGIDALSLEEMKGRVWLLFLWGPT